MAKTKKAIGSLIEQWFETDKALWADTALCKRIFSCSKPHRPEPGGVRAHRLCTKALADAAAAVDGRSSQLLHEYALLIKPDMRLRGASKGRAAAWASVRTIKALTPEQGEKSATIGQRRKAKRLKDLKKRLQDPVWNRKKQTAQAQDLEISERTLRSYLRAIKSGSS